MSVFDTLNSATQGMEVQSKRLRVVSENIANADTPGYRRKILPFKPDMDGRGPTVETGKVELDKTDLKEIFDPAHPMANNAGFVEMSNVEMVVEIADARAAQRSYEANLSVFDQARKMYTSVLDLLRR